MTKSDFFFLGNEIIIVEAEKENESFLLKIEELEVAQQTTARDLLDAHARLRDSKKETSRRESDVSLREGETDRLKEEIASLRDELRSVRHNSENIQRDLIQVQRSLKESQEELELERLDKEIAQMNLEEVETQLVSVRSELDALQIHQRVASSIQNNEQSLSVPQDGSDRTCCVEGCCSFPSLEST